MNTCVLCFLCESMKALHY